MRPSLGCFRVSLCVCCLLSVHELVTLGPYPHHSPSLSPTSVLQGLATGMVWEPGSSLRPTCSQVPGGAGVGWGALDAGATPVSDLLLPPEFPGANGFRNGESGGECRRWGEGHPGAGRNHLVLLQGSGKKRQSTPRQQLQALKEMVGNECFGGERWQGPWGPRQAGGGF